MFAPISTFCCATMQHATKSASKNGALILYSSYTHPILIVYSSYTHSVDNVGLFIMLFCSSLVYSEKKQYLCSTI